MSCSMLLLNLLDCAENQALVLHFHAVLPAVLMTEEFLVMGNTCCAIAL